MVITTTATETRKSIEKRIDELLAEKNEVLGLDDADDFKAPTLGPATLAKLEEIDDKIQSLNVALRDVVASETQAQRAVEDADIAARRMAYPLH